MGPADWHPVYHAAGMAQLQSDPGRVALARVHRLIREHSTHPWDLGSLARVAGYSPAHFLRRYARVYGRTPARDLTHHRLLHARDLLESTELSVTEVCSRVGFTSLGSFSSRFRDQFGRPPSHWRRHVWALGERTAVRVAVPACFLRRHAMVGVDRRGPEGSSKTATSEKHSRG